MAEGQIDSKTKYEFDGEVLDVYQGSQYKVEIEFEEKKTEILAYISGRMRKYYIKILPGDQVRVEISPYDLTRGRIVYRYDKDKYGNVKKPETKTTTKK